MRMAAAGIDVTIISGKDSMQPASENIGNISVDRMSRLVIAPLVRKRQLIEKIVQTKPGLVIWSGTPLSALYLARLRSLPVPIIWDVENAIPKLKLFGRIGIREILCPHHNQSLLIQFLTALCPPFMIRAVGNSSMISKIVVPSEHVMRCLCDTGILAGKIAVIPSAVEVKAHDREDCREIRRRLDLEAEEFILTYFGSPCTLRGVDTAVRSMKTILRNRAGVRLVILSRRESEGLGDRRGYMRAEEEYLAKLARELGVGPQVRIVSGVLNRLELMQYIRACDVVVLPFKLILSEPPLSVLEGMGLGKVVVTTNVGSASYFVDQARGILIEPGRADALAQAVLHLSRHPEESTRIGGNAQRFALELPDWDYITNRLLQVLQETLAKHRCGR